MYPTLLADAVETGGAGAAGGVAGVVIITLLNMLREKHNVRADDNATTSDLAAAIAGRRDIVDQQFQQLTDRLDRNDRELEAIEEMLQTVRDVARDSARDIQRLSE
jgi:ABC-type transporter Mla subunit MlaD